MGYFKDDQDIVEVKLKSNSDYWVKIRKNYKWREQKSFVAFDDNGNIDMEVGASKFLTRIIVEWNLDDENGVILPITEENIDRMEGVDAMDIISHVNGVIADEKKAATKNS